MRAVIFDLDGVLVRTDQAHDKAWRALAVRLGIPFDGRAAARLRGVSRMEALDIVLEGCGRSFTPAEKEALAAEKNERYRALIAEMTPADVAPDTTVTLKALRERGLLLAVASSSKNARFILERTGLTPYFHAVVDGTQIARSKPDPEVFLKAAQALGVSPAEALVVEDAAAAFPAPPSAPPLRRRALRTTKSGPCRSFWSWSDRSIQPERRTRHGQTMPDPRADRAAAHRLCRLPGPVCGGAGPGGERPGRDLHLS